MPYADVRYTREAIRRMGERKISRAEVEGVLSGGMVLRRYPETQPESYLMLGWTAGEAYLVQDQGVFLASGSNSSQP